MTEPIVLNGITYHPATEPSCIRIVVLQRGNVVVGRFSRDGDMCQLTDAAVIRRWGTSRGLGQIAVDGPTPETVLDAAGRVEFHILTAVMLIDANANKWNNRLGVSL